MKRSDIAESVIHHYGRAAFLSRLSDPFWFRAYLPALFEAIALPPRRESRHQAGALLPYPHVMSMNVQIEVDEQTADVLQTRAAQLGVTVSELVAELATLESEPTAVEAEDIAELDRRWKKVEAGGRTVPHERVVRWLRTWGTPRFEPWQGQ